jgi:tetratricopeptide (TPR) repeat protein
MKNLFILFLLMICSINQVFASTNAELFTQGVTLLQDGKNAEAVNAFTQLIQQMPKSPDAYRNRGVGYMELKQYDDAILDFEKAIELNPELAGLYANMGAAWYHKKAYTTAIDFYNKDLALRPDNYIVYLDRALCWGALNDYDNGIADTDKSLELTPNFYAALCLKGDFLTKMGQEELAIQTYEKAHALEGNNDYANKRLTTLRREIQEKQGTEDQNEETVRNVKQEPGNKKTSISSPGETTYTLQVGAFTKKANAENLLNKCIEKGYEATIIERNDTKGRTWTLVLIGTFNTRSQADKYRQSIQSDLGSEIIIRPLDQF